MNSNFGKDCNTCDARPLCLLRIEELARIEARASRIGALVSEGNVFCPDGPLLNLRRDQARYSCQVDPVMPIVSDVELAEEIAAVWPNAPLQPIAE